MGAHAGAVRIYALMTHWAVEIYVPFWTNEKGAGAWDFKVVSSQVEGGRREINKFSLGMCPHAVRSNGARKEVQEAGFATFPLSTI